jgi:hypothetical protein
MLASNVEREDAKSFCVDGTWRSLVARFLGVEEVAGSNPVVPIRIQTQDERPKTETLQSVIPPTRRINTGPSLDASSWAFSFLGAWYA